LASISDNTWKQYNSGLKKWWSFCAIHKENPYQISANKLLRFLTKMFSEGASYGSLNSFRSAISLVSHGVDIETIRKTAGWSTGSSVFARFYNRPITSTNSKFARAVIS
ncbi:hypothetical protein ALC57_13242, partial [Trachymyrmex cornetzi]